MIHVQPSRPYQLRRACDRCHKSKLRCLRDNEVEPCRRCQQLHVECCSSPVSRGRRQSKLQQQQSKDNQQSQKPVTVNPATSTDHQRTPSASEPLSSIKAATTGKPGPDGPVHPPGVPTSDEVGPSQQHTDQGAAVPETHLRNISEIGISLIKHLRAISPLASVGGTYQALSGEAPECAIDNIFHLSETFIKALQHLLPRLPPPNREPSVPSPPPPNDFSLDAASELLIFSTYLRFIETYYVILQHLHAHGQQGKDALQGESHQLQIPAWSMGSYQLASQPRAQVLFVVHVIEDMLTQAQKLIDELVFPKATFGWRGNYECFGGLSLRIVPDLAIQAIRTRELAALRLAQHIKKDNT
ncbi:hypothetical protein E8E14_011099 [Neopestalotiopsis sp. 37M]|nr:hypothetical protein E8E14_011099 [Neopestalotiopsis sp. 37M]